MEIITAKMLGLAIIKGVFPLPHLSEAQTVENGQIPNVPCNPIILHTPGHTDGEITLLLEDRKIVITGDTILTRNLLTVELGQPQLNNPILNKNYKQAMFSLDKLRKLEDVMILPSHETLWFENMKDAVNIALENSIKK